MRLTAPTAGMARIAAFVATLVLVLQTALVAASPPVERDIFGNVICAPGSTEIPSDGGAKHLPDCCLLSCSAASQNTAGLPPQAEWPAPVHFVASIPLPAPAVFPQHDRRTPANPRAPPAAA